MNIGVIATMAGITVGSAVAQAILASSGKMDEAKFMDIATKSGLGVTVLVLFASFLKNLRTLG